MTPRIAITDRSGRVLEIVDEDEAVEFITPDDRDVLDELGSVAIDHGAYSGCTFTRRAEDQPKWTPETARRRVGGSFGT